MRVEKNAAKPSSMTKISKTLTAIRTVRLLTAIGQVPGVAGEEQEGQHEDGAGEGQVLAAGSAGAATCTARSETAIL